MKDNYILFILAGLIIYLLYRNSRTSQPAIMYEDYYTPVKPDGVQTYIENTLGGSPYEIPSAISDFSPEWLSNMPFECISYLGMISPYPQCNKHMEQIPTMML